MQELGMIDRIEPIATRSGSATAASRAAASLQAVVRAGQALARRPQGPSVTPDQDHPRGGEDVRPLDGELRRGASPDTLGGHRIRPGRRTDGSVPSAHGSHRVSTAADLCTGSRCPTRGYRGPVAFSTIGWRTRRRAAQVYIPPPVVTGFDILLLVARMASWDSDDGRRTFRTLLHALVRRRVRRCRSRRAKWSTRVMMDRYGRRISLTRPRSQRRAGHPLLASASKATGTSEKLGNAARLVLSNPRL